MIIPALDNVSGTQPEGTLHHGLLRLFDSWPDAVVLVDANGAIKHTNPAAASLFGYSTTELMALSVEDLVPPAFSERHVSYRASYNAEPQSRTMATGASFECKRADGSCFPAEVHLEPVNIDGSVMTWAIIRDLSESQMPDDISEIERKSLMGIGQMAASAVDFQTRQREFGALLRSLVPSDSTTIATIMPGDKTVYVAYVDHELPVHENSPKHGKVWHIKGTTAETVVATQQAVIRNFADYDEFKRNYTGIQSPSKENPVRAVMTVPLVANGEIFGFLTFRTTSETDYDSNHLRRGKSIAAMISGSVAQMELRRRQTESDNKERVLKKMGQLLASTLNTEEVFGQFSDAASKLLDFNVLAIVRLEHEKGIVSMDHISVRDTEPINGRGPGSVYSSSGTMMEFHRDESDPVIITAKNGKNLSDRYPGAVPDGVKSHMLSTILIPLLRTPSFNASLLVQSTEFATYTEADAEIAAKIALAVKGPLASAYVHTRELELSRERELHLQAQFEKKRFREISDAKSQFLGMLSHELKTPLTSITAFADILHKNKSGNLNPREAQQVAAIRRNGRLLESLITELLDLSRMEVGSVTLDPQIVFPGQLIDECIVELEAMLAGKSQSLKLDVEGVDTVVIADPQRLRQVLINLIGNACKYSPEGSLITVRCHTDAECLTVSIIDEGPGVSDEDLDQVFDLFGRGKDPGVASQPGTGIGLYVARKIIEAHGGTISLTSNVTVGSTAKFTIPQHADQQALAKPV